MAKQLHTMFTLRAIVIIVGLFSLIMLAGFYFYSQSTQSVLNTTYNHLETITEIKSKQIQEWYKDEQLDAKTISNNPFFQNILFAFFDNFSPQIKHELETYLNYIEIEHGLLGIYIINDNRQVLLETKTGDDKIICDKHSISGTKDSVMNTVIHYDKETHSYAINFLYPIHYKDSLYFIVFQHNANSFLFPLVALWPNESQSSETYIIQKEEDSVFVLNMKTDESDSLPFKVPMFKTERASVQAAMGKTGRIQARDFSNKKILAYVSKVPDTQWSIISKVNQDEVYASIRKNSILIFVFIILIVAFLAFAFAFLYANKQRKMFKHLLKIQQQFKTTLYSIGDGVITTDKKGKVQYMNPVAEQLTGWRESEAQGKPIDEVFVIVNEKTRETIENPVHKVIHEGNIVGLVNHTILINKNSLIEIPIADSGAPIINETGELLGVVLVFRDQSDEYSSKQIIEQSNKTLTTLISNLPGIAYSCKNISTWDMIYISDSCEIITGYTSQEFTQSYGISFGTLIHADDRQYVYDTIQNALAQRSKFQLEYRIITKFNKILYVWEQGQGIFSPTNELESIDGYIVDVTGIKQNEIDLAKSTQILQTILDTIPLGVFWKDIELRYAGANKQFLYDTNVTLEELLGKTDAELRWKDKADEFMGIDREIIQTQIPKLNYEEQLITETLEMGWLKTSKIPLRNEQGEIQGIMGLYENITEQKHMMQELRESEELYRMQFEEHNAIKIILDPEDMQIININKAAIDIYGWSKEEFLSMKITDVDAGGQETFNRLEDSLKNNKKYFETIHRKADGTCMNVEVYGSDIYIKNKRYVHNIVHDITEKKLAEDKIKLQIRAIEQSPVSIVITNNIGNIEYVNPKFTEVTGYSFAEVVGKNSNILKSGYQSTEYYKLLWDTIKSGNDWIGELQNKRKNGEIFWEQAVISPIVNSNQEITHFVAVKEDITEKKQMLEDLIAAKEKAEESDKLKTAFLANMSHEIRTPMNGIIGFSEMLADTMVSEAKRKEYANIVVNSSKQLLSLVNDILDISKIEAGEISISIDSFYINNLLQEVYSFFKPQAVHKGLAFELVKAFADNNSLIETDKNRLRQIMVNLVSNAIKFTPQGLIQFGYTYANNTITFFVKDTGIGIPEHLQTQIFERFRQGEFETTKLYGGTGLGLSISQKLAELLGGHIQVESEPDRGSLFSFSIAHNPQLQKKDEEKQLSASINFQKATILIAEDNDTNFQLLEATLSKSNVTILRAVNGQDAIDICLQNSAIQFVLMDIRMPKIDGIHAATEIKQYRPTLPIVIQSAYKANEERARALEAGCDDYLTKPIKKQELLACLAKYLQS